MESVDETIEKLRRLFCDIEEVGVGRLCSPKAGQNSALVKFAGRNFEFMEPNGDVGVVPKFLSQKGPGFHHLGVYCSDVVELAKRFREAGLTILGDPEKGGFFSLPKETGGVLYEFSNTDDMERKI